MEKCLRMAASAKRRSVCVHAMWTALAFAFCLTASAQKRPAENQRQPADTQADQNHERDDPRARAAYLEKRRSGGQPVPRGARLHAMLQQEQMMQNEGKRFWEKRSAD